jgi:N-methylhydantoinase A
LEFIRSYRLCDRAVPAPVLLTQTCAAFKCRPTTFTQKMRRWLHDAFEQEYRWLYSRVIPGVEVEALSWVLLLSVPPPAQTSAPAPSPQPYTPAPAKLRPLFAPDSGEFIVVAIHQRRDLRPGALIPGPAVIAEDETSTVVSRLFDAKIDRFGYIELTRRSD